MTPSGSTTHNRSTRSLCPPPWTATFSLGTLTFLLLLSLSVAATLTPSYPVDDAYITYRHVQNWIRGFGPVFNPGEDLDASSSFLHVFLLTLTGLLRADTVVSARLLNVGASAIPGILLLLRYTSSAHPPGLRTLAILAVSILALSPHTSLNVNSGLEAPIAAALLYVAIYLLPTPLAFFSPLILLLSSLTRPEHAFIATLVLGAIGLNSRHSPRTMPRLPLLLSSTAIAACLYVSYQLWHLSYYGALLPNSIYAKSGFSAVEQISRSLAYESQFLALYAPIFLTIIVLSIFPFTPAARSFRLSYSPSVRPLSFGLGSLLALGLILGSGDPYSSFARYLYPALPLALDLALALAARFLPRASKPFLLNPLMILLSVSLGTQLSVSLAKHPALATAGISQLVPQVATGFRSLTAVDRRPHTDLSVRPGGALHSLAQWLLINSRSDALIATSEIGIIAYYTDMRILDTFGLADRRIARLPGIPGGKTDADYVFSKTPDYIAVKVSSSCFCGGTPGDNRVLTDYRILASYDAVRFFPAGDAVLILFRRRTHDMFRVHYDFVRNFDYGRVRFRRSDGSVYTDNALAQQVAGNSGVAVIMADDYRSHMMGQLERFLAPDVADLAPADVMREWLSEWRALLYHHPINNTLWPEIHYTVDVPAGATLDFAVGTDPNFWGDEFGDGVEYEIQLDDGSGPQSLFSQYIDAKRNPMDRGWRTHSLDLSRWAGREVEISFLVKPGPQDDGAYDFGGWGLPQIRTHGANGEK